MSNTFVTCTTKNINIVGQQHHLKCYCSVKKSLWTAAISTFLSITYPQHELISSSCPNWETWVKQISQNIIQNSTRTRPKTLNVKWLGSTCQHIHVLMYLLLLNFRMSWQEFHGICSTSMTILPKNIENTLRWHLFLKVLMESARCRYHIATN